VKNLYLIIFNNTHYNRKQRKLMTFNRLEDKKQKVLIKWDVTFYDNKPQIINLEVFCINHGEVPIKFINERCQIDKKCENSKGSNTEGLYNGIESLVIHRWEEINSKK